MAEISQKWWQNTIVYQIYPKSFADTTGSGTGDLNGIISHLDYLKSLNVGAIWLTPIYPSPQVDNGYDISDYTAINPDYGTIEDFDKLVAEGKKRNIRVVMDLVIGIFGVTPSLTVRRPLIGAVFSAARLGNGAKKGNNIIFTLLRLNSPI